MRITPEEARRRLNASGNLSQLAVPSRDSQVSSWVEPAESFSKIQHGVLTKRGMPKGTTKPAENVRDMIMDMAQTMKQKDVAESMGMSKQAVSSIVNGKSGANPPTPERAIKVLDRQLHIKDVALTKLMQSLNLIGDENLSELGAKDLSAVASNMSKVVHSLSGAEGSGTPVNIVVYAPEMRSEEKFKVIDV